MQIENFDHFSLKALKPLFFILISAAPSAGARGAGGAHAGSESGGAPRAGWGPERPLPWISLADTRPGRALKPLGWNLLFVKN